VWLHYVVKYLAPFDAQQPMTRFYVNPQMLIGVFHRCQCQRVVNVEGIMLLLLLLLLIGVNLVGILGRRRGGSRRLGWGKALGPQGNLSPSQKKNEFFLLEIACFGESEHFLLKIWGQSALAFPTSKSFSPCDLPMLLVVAVVVEVLRCQLAYVCCSAGDRCA